MIKEFTTHKAEEIPLIYDSVLQVSEWMFCIAKTVNGDFKNSLTSYDFRKNKWIFTRAGFIELVEYYKLK